MLRAVTPEAYKRSGVTLHLHSTQRMVTCMMATNVRALQTVSFLLMLAITVNARVVSEQGGQEDNGEMSREFLHDIKQGSIDQMKNEILALLLNDQETIAQSLFEEDLNIPKKEMDPAYRPSTETRRSSSSRWHVQSRSL